MEKNLAIAILWLFSLGFLIIISIKLDGFIQILVFVIGLFITIFIAEEARK